MRRAAQRSMRRRWARRTIRSGAVAQSSSPAAPPWAAAFLAAPFLAALAGSSLLLSSELAQASGGLFHGREPVAQTAERILFEVGPDSVTMTTQSSYDGSAQDFAWILPLSAVPDVNSLAVFPQAALNALDSVSTPTFTASPECYFVQEQPPGVAAAGDARSASNFSARLARVYGFCRKAWRARAPSAP